jgi:membrane associated rhomboid family serine protease
MLEDRQYMRRSPFDSRLSATVVLVLFNVIAFIVECGFYHYPPQIPRLSHPDYFALSTAGLRQGYVWQLLTFQFMHAGLLHLFFNCWAIFVFGRELESALGRGRFLALYFSSGVMGGLVQALAGALAEQYLPNSEWALRFAAPVMGASAGGMGLIAAYAMLYPERPLMMLLFFIIPVQMRAKFLLLFCALLAVFGIVFPVSNMADIAHLGGMLTGVFFIRFAQNWQWPRFRRAARPPPRRLVKVPSSEVASWRQSKDLAEDLPPADFLAREVDPILDKISSHGIQSLTERERKILESARARMGKR